MSGQPAVPTDARRAAVAQRRAWLSLLLYLASGVAAFVVGEGLASLLGYPSGGDGTTPFWVVLVAGVPALLVFAIPGLLAVYFGRVAIRLGRPSGRTPALLGAGIAVVFIGQNVLAYLLQTAFG